ncbi:early light inducible protein [Genlisea aurea]|uniref:Early light inducible protein n=1 Tax=Genlisea aurea TaxID=192259 RepID=S8DZE3_9LAMI|nr:early light inducible protein [Genlisea aurea]
MAASISSSMLSISNATPLISRPKRTKFRVRSISDGEKPTEAENVPKAKAPPPPPPTLSRIFAFGGPGPERINGRLAMIGFVAAIGAEFASGQDLSEQLQNGGVSWFLATSAVLTLASLVPLFQGVTAESTSGALMSSDAELWNGRFAMLGLVALAFTEYVKGGALV